jgi:2-polyprenyl-6-hydroxyphenyl methylase/3-demethylubiquinone-9 3-methyltransferase
LPTELPKQFVHNICRFHLLGIAFHVLNSNECSRIRAKEYNNLAEAISFAKVCIPTHWIVTMTNADPLELDKFSLLAHKWWDPNSEFKPLHDMNPLRLGYIDRTAGLTGKTVLDIGCGGGILSESMAALKADVTGIDLSDKVLQVAKLHLLESGQRVSYRKISAENMALEKPASYQVVTCLEMLEHVPDPQSIVTACAKLAKPGGWVFFSTVNRNPKSYMLAILAAEYVMKLLPRGTHDFNKFIKPSELAQFCRNAGLSVVNISGMSYNPLSQEYSLSDDISVNYLIACRQS